MKVYFDMCALKRPFDDQSNNRVWIETQAVLRLLDLAHLAELHAVNSAALQLENSMNPKPVRRFRVDRLLRSFGRGSPIDNALLQKAATIGSLGFDDMDALHLASAHALRCQRFITCDDGILRRARRTGYAMFPVVLNPVDFLKEFKP